MKNIKKVITVICTLLLVFTGMCLKNTNTVYASEPPEYFFTTDGEQVDQGVTVQFWFDFNLISFDRSTGNATYRVTSRYHYDKPGNLLTDELYVNGAYIGAFTSHNGRAPAGNGNRTEKFEVTLHEGNNTIKTTGAGGVGGNTATTKYIPKFREYTVTFLDYDGTQLKKQTVQSDDNGYCATAPSNPTRTGYTFVKWDRGYCNFTSDITVKAQYSVNTYSVKYNGNGATSGSMSNSSHTYDTAKKLNTNQYARTGYKFIEWNTKADGTGTRYTDGQSVKNLTSTNNATFNLYAMWDKAPSITVSDRSYYENELTVDEWQSLRMNGVSASDVEDGTITNKIKVIKDTVDPMKPGTYEVTYQVTDSVGQVVAKTITVTIKKNNPPVLLAYDKTYYQNQYSQAEWETKLRMHNVSAFDIEDGNITDQIHVTLDNVEMDKVGTQEVVYEVTDAYGKTAQKKITVTILYNHPPVINAENKTFHENEITPEEWQSLRKNGVSASDVEDGNLTDQIKIVNDTVDLTKPGVYEITYSVIDSLGKTTLKTIDVNILENWEPVLQIFAPSKRFVEGTYTNEQWQNEIRMIGASAHDREDADLTDQIVITKDTTDPSKAGEYEVTYSVTDRWGKTVEKTIRVIVEENKAPEIFAFDKYFTTNDHITDEELLKNVTAQDDRDGDISDDIGIVYSDVVSGQEGEYQVIYEVRDSLGKSSQKTITVYIRNDGNDTIIPPIESDPQALMIQNGRQLAQVEITKEMEESLFDDDAYRDVVFGVYAAEDIAYKDEIILKRDSLVGIGTVDENHKVNVMLYHPGRYYVQELKSADNYQVDDTKYYFTFQYNKK